MRFLTVFGVRGFVVFSTTCKSLAAEYHQNLSMLICNKWEINIHGTVTGKSQVASKISQIVIFFK